MIHYPQELNLKRYRCPCELGLVGHQNLTDLKIGEECPEFYEYLEQGLADGWLVGWGVFDCDHPCVWVVEKLAESSWARAARSSLRFDSLS